MMGGRVALCVDELTFRNPELMGLDGEAIESQGWLDVFMTGEEARREIAGSSLFDEVWVASSEDIDPINLAATLKSDRPDLPVRLIVEEGCGSLLSRAHTASIDEVVDKSVFAKLYGDAKRRFAASGGRGGGAALTVERRPPEPEPGQGGMQLAAEPAVGLLPAAPVRPAALVAARNRAFVMPVVSGSGGAGKSTVSALAACISRERGQRTLLLDYDLQFGDVAAMLGQPDCLTVDEAVRHPEAFRREIASDRGLVVLAAPERLEQAEEAVRGIPALLEQASQTFDVVVANTGGAWAEQHAALLERSHVSLFLIDQRASSIRACRHALELCARCGIATGPFEFALNRCAKGAPLTAADVSSALQGAPVYELKDGGREVEEYLGAGAVDELMRTGNELVASLRQVADRLLPDAAGRPGAEAEQAGRHAPRRRGRHVGRKRGRRS